MTVRDRIKREVEEVALVTLFFLIGFFFILFMKKLLLEEYAIEFYGLSTAVISALIVAKVLIVLDKFHICDQFRRYPYWVPLLYKTIIYTFAVFLVTGAEKVFEVYREVQALGTAIREVFHGIHIFHLLHTNVSVFILFLAYNALTAIS